MAAKMMSSSEGDRLCYVSHNVQGNMLTIVQKSPNVQTETLFTAYDDCNALRIQTKVTNITDTPIVLEEVSAFCLTGIGDKDDPENLLITKFLQSHHTECQPQTRTMKELGIYGGVRQTQHRTGGCNIGSWSSKEMLPMGILEDRKNGNFLMFQIESNNSWYYEVSDFMHKYYLALGGPNFPFGGWFKTLQPGESYCTPYVALSFGKSLNEVVGDMTRYRRHIAGVAAVDAHLPTIFNEYMHLSWDSPTAENTATTLVSFQPHFSKW